MFEIAVFMVAYYPQLTFWSSHAVPPSTSPVNLSFY